MTLGEELLARAVDTTRPPEFGEISFGLDGMPVIAYAPAGYASGEWRLTRGVWRQLPRSPFILQCRDPDYAAAPHAHVATAAIDWTFEPLKVKRDLVAAATVGGWAVEVARAYQTVQESVGLLEGRWLTRPRLYIDVVARVRIAFLPGDPNATDDERDLVFAVAHAVTTQLVADRQLGTDPVSNVLKAALVMDPRKRIPDLFELCGQLNAAGATSLGEVSDEDAAAWRHVDGGIGALAAQRFVDAAAEFARALQFESSAYSVARAGLVRAAMNDPVAARVTTEHRWRASEKFLRESFPGEVRDLTWADARAQAAPLEAARDFRQAAVTYQRVSEDDFCVDYHVAVARCALALEDVGIAEDHAGRALASEPQNVEALALRAKAILLANRPRDALATIERWIALAPISGAACYQQGRAFVALGRLPDAIAALDRAIKLDPKLLEAQLLRREVDRTASATRAATGVQQALALPIPPHLAELRAALTASTPSHAIAYLSQPEHANDPVAQLLLAGCLAFAGRTAEALAAYERVAAMRTPQRAAALVGHARMLLELARPADALAILDATCSEFPHDADASETRATALARLGRADDADREFARAMSLITLGSELRVRVASES